MLIRLALFCALAGTFLALPLSPTLALSESQQDAAIASLQSAVSTLQSQNTSLQSQVNALKSITSGFTRVTDTTRADGKKGTELFLTGFNFHVVNGLGATDGDPSNTGTTAVNGLGNVIIGYNVPRGDATDVRTGSHNLVLGDFQSYSSYGGLQGGFYSTITGPYASISGGAQNTASGEGASVSGGVRNTVSGDFSSVSGGTNNAVYGEYSSIGGGFNQTSPVTSTYDFKPTVAGPKGDTGANGAQGAIGPKGANGLQGPVGRTGAGFTAANQAVISMFSLGNGVGSGTELYLTGVNLHVVNGLGATDGDPNDTGTTHINGLGNVIIGYNASGGSSDVRTGSHNLVLGDDNNYSSYAGIVSGFANTLGGAYSSVSSGANNIASAEYSSVTGGIGNKASSIGSSVAGGLSNTASGYYSSVGGGYVNIASGTTSSVSGGYFNTASGSYSSISGGYKNMTSGQEDTISGGAYNSVTGDTSSISGGEYNLVDNDLSSISGGRYVLGTEQFGFAAGGIYSSSSPGPGTFHSP